MTEKKKIQKRRPRSKPGELPQILKTKNGSAYMNYRGSRYFLGTYGSDEAEQKRRQIVAEFAAGLEISPQRREPVKIAMLVLRFLDWAKKRFRKNGRSTGSYERFRLAVEPLLKLYADLPVSEFRPLALKAVRQAMIDSGNLCRETINTRIGFICRMFRWGVANELVPVENMTALETVDGLRPGEEDLREMPDVEEVELHVVLKTLPLLSSAVGAMVRLQMRSGMRPGEVVAMRPADIYREGDRLPKGYRSAGRKLKGCWIYIPEEHKTEHHKKIRFIVLDAGCQKILDPFLARCGHEEYVFSPAREHAIRMEKLRNKRQSKVQPSQICRQKENPKRKPGPKYTPDSYRTSIQRAIERFDDRLILPWAKKQTFAAKFSNDKLLLAWCKEQIETGHIKAEELNLIPNWFPNQLRHYFATVVRENEDLEAAQVALGHSNSKTTEIYAKKSIARAVDVVLQSNIEID